MHETSLFMLATSMLCGYTSIYSSTDGYSCCWRLLVCLFVWFLLQTALQWTFSSGYRWSKDSQGMQPREHCWVTGLRIFSTLVYRPKLFFQRACCSLHSDVPVLGKNIENLLGEHYACTERVLEFQKTGRISAHTCHMEFRSHKHSCRGRRVFVVYIISNKESLEMSGFVAPWLWGENLPTINLYYSAHEQNTL